MSIVRDGVAIHYELHGAAGEPVLMLMGLGIDATGWERQVPAFAARHRLITVDNRGVGRSGKPPGPYTTAEMADDAVAVLDAAGVVCAHVVGLSMGGMIAQELALRHPARVSSLVLAATSARPGDDARNTAQGIDPARLDLRELMRFLMPLVFSEKFLRDEKAFLQQMLARAIANGFAVEGFVAQVGAVMAHDTEARLPSLRAPTLVVTGTDDRLVPPRHSDELARLIPGAKLVRLDGGTHGFNLESPDRFNQVVLDFLAAQAVDRAPPAQ